MMNVTDSWLLVTQADFICTIILYNLNVCTYANIFFPEVYLPRHFHHWCVTLGLLQRMEMVTSRGVKISVSSNVH